MTKGFLIKATLSLMLFIGHIAQASETPDRKFNLGVTTYATVIGDGSNTQQELTGGGLLASYAFTNNIGMRINAGSLSHDSFYNVDSNTAELSLLFGRNLARTGWKVYGAAGMFQDKWKIKNSDISETFSGPLLTGGIGYHWNRVSFEFWLSLRKSSEYDSIRTDRYDSSDIAGSGGWALAVRF